MVVPLRSGSRGAQRLMLYERDGRGFSESVLEEVLFVPLEAGKI